MEPSDSVIAVTGAGGFIGHSLCRRLLADKVAVRAMVRYRSDLPGEFQFDLQNNILDPAALKAPVKALVHCAWDFKPTSRAESKRINIDGTRWLIDQCRAAGVQQFVFVSCLSSHMVAASVHEATQFKLETEILGLTEAATFSTVIATGTVIGNGGSFARARTAFKHRKVIPRIYSLGLKVLPTVYIDDLCSAIIASIDRRVTNRRLCVADSQGVSLSDFYQGLSMLEHSKSVQLPTPELLPEPMLASIGIKPAISSDKLVSARSLHKIDFAETNRLLGCQPMANYWQSLERLAIQEGSTDIANQIREMGQEK
jgi:nucleoside-diphosphate-sugar epimerase